MAPSGGPVLSFGEIELYLDSGELFRAGERVKLQPQPAKVLEVLASRSGEVASREEIRKLVWGEETFVDLDASLNFCIKQIRQALGDSALAPRFIETIPRRGYRFLVPVQTRSRISPAPEMEPEPSPPVEETPEAPVRPVVAAALPDQSLQHVRPLGLAVAAVALALLALALVPVKQQPGSPERTERASAPRVTPPAAQEHYQKALYLRGSDRRQAREELKKALLLAPGFAEAHAMLAWLEIKSDSNPERLLPQAEITARKAVELDPDLALGHLALGEILFRCALDWQQAETELRRAVELDPGLAEAWHSLAHLLAALGEHEEAIASAQRAREADPAAMFVNTDLAWFYYLDQQYDEAVRQAANVLELKAAKEKAGSLSREDRSYFLWAWRVILLSSQQTGDRRAGIEAAQALMENQGDSAAARLANVEEYWRRERERMLKIESEKPGRVPPAVLAQNAAATGETELALSYLEEACRRKWPDALITAASHPLFIPLREDPRFTRFLDCIRVPADAPARRGLPTAGEP